MQSIKTTKYRNFDLFFTIIVEALLPLPNPGQIWQEIVDQRYTLTYQISFEYIYCVSFWGWKPQFEADVDI